MRIENGNILEIKGSEYEIIEIEGDSIVIQCIGTPNFSTVSMRQLIKDGAKVIKLTAQNTLNKLNTTVTKGMTGTIETQFGDVSVKKTVLGYCATFITASGHKMLAYADVPSIAFLKITDQIKAAAPQ